MISSFSGKTIIEILYSSFIEHIVYYISEINSINILEFLASCLEVI